MPFEAAQITQRGRNLRAPMWPPILSVTLLSPNMELMCHLINALSSVIQGLVSTLANGPAVALSPIPNHRLSFQASVPKT